MCRKRRHGTSLKLSLMSTISEQRRPALARRPLTLFHIRSDLTIENSRDRAGFPTPLNDAFRGVAVFHATAGICRVS